MKLSLEATAAVMALIQDLRQNLARSPWAQSLAPINWLDWADGELEELREEMALKEDSEIDMTKLEDELSDVYWCVITMTLAMMQKGWINPASVFRHAVEKLRARKPWIFDGSTITWSAKEEHVKYLERKAELKAKGP